MHSATVVSSIAEDVSIGDVGLAGIVTLIILLILSGKLITRRAHDDAIAAERRAAEAERVDKEYWRATAGTRDEALRIALEHTRELMEFNDTVDHFFRSIPKPDERGDEPA